jgi:hypothetical protein
MLTPGELAVGNDVTVVEASLFPVEVYQDSEGKMHGQKMSPALNMYKGIPMKITAVNLPYVIVESIGQPIVLDTRLVKFMEITKEYVEAAVIKPAPQDRAKGKEDIIKLMEAVRNRQF